MQLSRSFILTLLVVLSSAVPAPCAEWSPDPAAGLTNLSLSSHYEPVALSVTPNPLPYRLPLAITKIPNGGHVCNALGLNTNARLAIEQNGFVVVPGTDDDEAALFVYGKNWKEGIPNYITSDFVLHLYHLQFDFILKSIEEQHFYGDLSLMTMALALESGRQYERFSDELKEAARRNAACLFVALALLGDPSEPPDYVAEEVQNELAKIEAHTGYETNNIFHYKEDYSQYVPRGHYTRSEILKAYFKAMMWYGRMGFLLKGSDPWGPDCKALISPEDARIQTLQACLPPSALRRLPIGRGAHQLEHGSGETLPPRVLRNPARLAFARPACHGVRQHHHPHRPHRSHRQTTLLSGSAHPLSAGCPNHKRPRRPVPLHQRLQFSG